MPVSCHSCQRSFADYKELALHISSSRKGHGRGKKWAAKFIMINGLSPDKREGRKNQRVALTEADKENRVNSARQLSGDNKYTETLCPNCRTKQRQSLPVEFITNPFAWSINKKFVVVCSGCRR